MTGERTDLEYPWGAKQHREGVYSLRLGVLEYCHLPRRMPCWYGMAGESVDRGGEIKIQAG